MSGADRVRPLGVLVTPCLWVEKADLNDCFTLQQRKVIVAVIIGSL